MRGRLRQWRSRACARMLAAAVAAVLALPLAAVAADVVNVHDFREVLWSQGRPRTAEDIVRLKEIGVEWEKVTRKPVLDEMDTWLIKNEFNPPVSSGTPPHSAGSSGVFTDIDHSFAKFEDAQAAAKRFEELGYTVEWNAVDTFSVKELDYTGFAETRPSMALGSPEEVKFLREATRFPDKLWTRGSQDWVEGAKVKARINISDTRKGELVESLADPNLDAAERQALQSELDDVERDLAALGDELAAVKVTDRTGFTVDMFKKASHHMDPSKWCPVPDGFGCWEDPRQAAKAAGRALKEMPGTLSEAQQERLTWLEDIAGGRKVLPGEGAELEALKEKLLVEINRSMSEAYKASVAADAAFDQALVSEYETAVASGDAAAISRARNELAKRQLTARRIEATLEGIVEGEGAEASKVVHEWVTGERLRPVERPGKAPVYEVVEETAEGLKVAGTRTAAEVNETALKAIEKESLRTASKWSHPLGGYEPPSFSSVSPEDLTLAGEVKNGIKNVGPFTLLLAAYGAYAGGKQSVEMLNEHTEMKVLSASDFGDWRNITAEKVGGWATATTLGTVLAVSELTGVSHVGRAVAGAETTTDKIAAGGYATCQVLMVCTAYELGKWYSGEAIQAELEAAAREGRPASRARMAANLVGQVPFTRLGERMGKTIADWGKQRFTEIVDYGGSELAARRSEAASSEIAAQLEAALGANGIDTLAEHLTDLRLRTAALEQTWASGTGALDRAILGRQDMEILVEALKPVPDFEARCRTLLAGLGEDAGETAVKQARADWEKELETHAEKVRRALDAAVETLGQAVTAANVFSDVDMWESGLTDQGAVQRSLAARFGRLTLALPDNKALAAWRAEINSTANPVPIELRSDLAKEARSIAFEAEKTIRELGALLSHVIPPCDLPEPEEETPIAALPPAGVKGPITEPPARGDVETQAALPILKLIAIDGPELGEQTPGYDQHYTVEYEEGATGFRAFTNNPSYMDPAVPDWTSALKLTEVPLEITLGEPFAIGAELRKRVIYEPGDSCFLEEGGEIFAAQGGIYSHRSSDRTELSPVLRFDSLNAEVTGTDDLYAYCDPAAWAASRKGKVDTLVEKEGSVSLRAIFTPTSTEAPYGADSPTRKYHYQVQYQTNGRLTKAQEEYVITFSKKTDAKGNLHPEEERTSSISASPILLLFGWEISSFELFYDAIHEGAPHITALASYDWPEATTGPPPGSGTQPTGTGIAGVADRSRGTDGETNSAEGRTGPVDPNSLDAGSPEVAAHIQQWLATAEPPENAVPGGNWHYDNFGRLVGSGPGLRTTNTHDSVDYGGGSPEATAWSIRQKLDSINHCTLEEYVVARLEQKPIAQCAGRYGGLKDLRGLTLTDAKAAATDSGFRYVLAPGSPAATPADDGTIERQEPPPTQFLKKGATIKLVVHAPSLTQAPPALPNFTGKPLPEAKAWLQSNGLSMKLQPGSPAPAPELTGAVENQDPEPETKIAAGGTVTLAVHSNFVDVRRVPAVIGLPLGKAKSLLAAAGLDARLRPGSKPSSPQQAGTVERQEPGAGTVTAPGAEVDIFVYAPYVTSATVPDVRRLSLEAARQRLENAGLAILRQDGGSPPDSGLANLATRQDPESGTRVAPGQAVQVWFYGQYVNQERGNQAQDDGNTTNRQSDRQSGCPPGMIRGTKLGSWGQDEACIPIIDIGENNNPPPKSIDGSYTSTFGTITLRMQGSSVSGTYPHESRIEGTFSGSTGTLTGYWIQSNSGRKCSRQMFGTYYWGKLLLRFSENGGSFNGYYGYCDEAPSRSWTGSRSGN